MDKLEKENSQELDFDPVIVIASLGVPAHSLDAMLKRVYTSTWDDIKVVLAMHEILDPDNVNDAINLAAQHTELGHNVEVISVNRHSFAYAYLKGIQHASDQGNVVVEMDSGGGHLPEEIPSFLAALKSNEIALSSRFIRGATNAYPFGRRITSMAVTQMSNLFLGTNLTDAASGFEAFHSEVLNILFTDYPPEEWISALDGPFHMYQTELRAALTNVAKQYNYNIVEVPITYGAEKQGQNLPFSYLLQALICFAKIWLNKDKS